MKITEDNISIELRTINETSTNQLAATGKGSAINMVFIGNNKVIKEVISSNSEVDNIDVIDAKNIR